MINFENFAILHQNMCSLKETSQSTPHEPASALTDSLISVVNFDKVKNAYCQGLHLSHTPSSNDALHNNGKCLFFIEFKGGDIKSHHDSIKKKIYDSLLIFTDITQKSISYTRENMEYILVYDNVNFNNSAKEQISEFFVKKQAKKPFDRICLQQFETIYFKKVRTVSQSEFKDILRTISGE
ncbi:MAG: hypothetical protein ACRCTY_07665 [Candidatus Adiutrix sp.]